MVTNMELPYNNEHLAVPFVNLPRGASHVGHHCFFLFTQDYLSEHSYSYTSLILLIAENVPCCFRFALCLFVWLIKLKCPNPSHHYKTVSGDHM